MTLKPIIEPVRAVNDQVLLADWNGQMYQQARYEQEVIAGTNTDKVAPGAVSGVTASFVNLLTNGDFSIWQRGIGPLTVTPSSGAGIIADAWYFFFCTSAQDLATVDGTKYSYQLVVPSSTPQLSGYLQQDIYDMGRYLAGPMTFSCRIASPDGGSAVVGMSDGTSSIESASVTLSTTFQTLYVTLASLGSATNGVDVYVRCLTPNTFNVCNAMLTPTTAPVPYYPLPPAPNRSRADRRYLTLPFSARFRSQAIGEIRNYWVPFPAPLIAVPANSSLTSITGGTVANATVTIDSAYTSALGVMVKIVATAAGTDTQALNMTITVDAGLY